MNGRTTNFTDKALNPMPMGTNTLVNTRMDYFTDKVPIAIPLGENTSVNTRMTNDTDKAPLPLPMERFRQDIWDNDEFLYAQKVSPIVTVQQVPKAREDKKSAQTSSPV